MSTPASIYQYLRSQGVSHTHALGMLANIHGESAFNPSAVGDNGNAYGLFQHNGPRKRALMDYAGSASPSWQQQIDYALSEPDTTRYLGQQFADPAQATDWFTRKWERPANPDRDVARRVSALPELAAAIGSAPVDTRMAATDPVGEIPVSPYALPDRYGAQPPMADQSPLGLHPLVRQLQAQQQKDDPIALLRAAAGIFSADPNKPLDWLGQGLAGFTSGQNSKLGMLEGLQASNELYALEEARRNAGIKMRSTERQNEAKQRVIQQLRAQGKDQEADILEAELVTGSDNGRLLGIASPEDRPTYGVSQNPVEIGTWEDGTPKFGVIRLATDGTMKTEALPKGTQPVNTLPYDPGRQRAVAAAKAGGQIEGADQAQAQVDFPKVEAAASQTVQVIDTLLSDEDGMRRAVGYVSAFPTIPGTKAADYEARLNQLYGKNFLQAYQELKGGGQITEVEGKKAEQAITSLATSQSVEEHKAALKELRGVIERGYERARRKAAPNAPSLFGQPEPQQPPAGIANPAGLPDPLGLR